MAKDAKDQDQEKGDEILRRLLKTLPDPKIGKGENAAKRDKPRESEVGQAAKRR